MPPGADRRGDPATFADAAHLPLQEDVSGMAEPIDELFERAVRTHSRRLLAIARAIVGNRARPKTSCSRR